MTKGFNNHGIEELTEYQHLRLRTETYLGSRSLNTQNILIHTESGPVIKTMSWVPALMTCAREIIDNSLDEFTKAGIAGKLKVDYNEEDLSFIISDNGRGIPIDWNPEKGIHLATQVLSRLRAGRNFDDSKREGTAGMNGLGGSAVVNVSEYFDVEIHREGKPYRKSHGMYRFAQSFKEGDVLEDALQVGDPTIKKTISTATGTTCKFKLSSEVFKVRVLPAEMIRSLLTEIAAANIKHDIWFNGEKIKIAPFFHKTLFPNHPKPIKLTVKEDWFESEFFVLPDVVESGEPMSMHSLVNNIPTWDGGEHLDEFKTKFFLGLIKGLEKESKRRKLRPNRTDVEDTVLVYNVTRMNAPFFGSQEKTKLINPEVRKPINSALSDEFFNDIISKNKEWIAQIYERCEERTHKKDASEINAAAKKALKKKVAKLSDATAKRGKRVIPRHECHLFIMEGQSAASGLLQVRDPSIHGVLPLRGKILNVSTNGTTKANNEMKRKALESQATADIMNALGLVIGEKATKGNLRYGRLYIATDSDVDGGNIQALVVNFLYTYWPELFQPDPFTGEIFCHAFCTPFIIAEKGKTRKYWYADDVDTFDPEKYKGYAITRAKGLGTLMKEDWSHCITDIRSIPISYDDELKDTLSLIFSPELADERKDWMSK